MLAVLLIPTEVLSADYTITKKGETRTIVSNWGATWTGYIATPPKKLPLNKDEHKVSFDFSSPDYFKAGNTGHIAVGVNGNGYTIEGRGVVLGNVSGYPDKVHGCFAATEENAVVFESFWKTGNCVMGWSESVPLRNNIVYHIAITSSVDKVIEYSLYQYVGSTRYHLTTQRTYDYSSNDSAVDNGGWFLAEVFSAHDWTLYITNLQEG